MKRLIALLLAVVAILSLCAGCKKKAEVANKFGADGRVTLQIGLGSQAKITSFTENALTKWLESETGYNIEIVEYSGGTDISTQISTTIAARQNLPDILWGVSINDSTVSTYGKEGYFVDLKDYFYDKEGTGKIFWTRMEECLTPEQQQYVLRKSTDADTGGMYGVPTIETSLVDDLDFMVWINHEWLDKLQLEVPTNTDELYEVLKAFKTKDPNGNGKADEIPLFGSQNTSSPAQVLSWLINMFIYYNDGHQWQDYDGDGKIEAVYTQDKYREALKFVNKLYKEGLLTSMVYTATSAEMKTITTPQNGVALCGIFCGHLTSHTTFGSPVLDQYECLQTWGAATKGDISYGLDCFITETAQKRQVVDECWNLLMLMWTKDGALRIRYGEKGVNWTDADPGAKSEYGIDVQYKMLDDPFMQQNAAMWGDIASTLNDYAEGESAQIADELDPWQAKKSIKLATAYKYYEIALENNNPKFLKDPFLQSFVVTTAEDEAISMDRTNVSTVYNSYIKDFVTGSNGRDINADSHWKAFLAELDKQGYENLQKMYQTCYDRQK